MVSRRKYLKEYKIEAVRLANPPGVTLKLGGESGIKATLGGKWRQELQNEGQQGVLSGSWQS